MNSGKSWTASLRRCSRSPIAPTGHAQIARLCADERGRRSFAEKAGSELAARIAIDAAGVDEERAGDVLANRTRGIGHGIRYNPTGVKMVALSSPARYNTPDEALR